MSLILVPTPIGNHEDFSFRAQKILNEADIIIVEEFKESSAWLRKINIQGKRLEKLNEHSTASDLEQLTQLCRTQNIPLITDCGTPGFCDPGADLVAACRKENISVIALPGPSSLMTLLSLSSHRLDQFYFRGFLPAENQARTSAWRELVKNKLPLILMDTPYRLQKTLIELENFFEHRLCLLAVNLTQETEGVFEGTPSAIRQQYERQFPNQPKAEFMILIYPIKSDDNK